MQKNLKRADKKYRSSSNYTQTTLQTASTICSLFRLLYCTQSV